MLNTKSQIKLGVDFSKREDWRVVCVGKEEAKMKKWIRIWAFIILSFLLILIEEICLWYPESYYCQSIESCFRNPEPISMGNNDIISFSVSATVQTSGVTTTVLPYGTISNSTTTTT